MRTPSSARTLLLLSGGVESTTLLFQLLAQGRTPVPLFADYSQRSAEQERLAAARACESCGLPAPPQLLDLRAEGRAHQRINRLHVPLPLRNLTLLSLVLGWATTHRCSSVALGLNADDFGKDAEFAASGAVRYTTGTREFVQRFEGLAAVVAPGVAIELPQAAMTKTEVVAEGVRLGGAPALLRSYSCMRGRAIHCGTCMQCVARRAAFAEAAVREPAGFYER